MTTLSLAYELALPRRESPGLAPLLLLLHGVGSNEQDLFGLAEYLDERFFIVSARAPHTLGQGAYGWYHVQWTAAGPIGDADEARQSRDSITQFIGELTKQYPVDPQQVYLMGFSQGAILSLYTLLTRPELVAGIVAMSGRLLPEAWAERVSNEQLTGKPVFAVHGTADQTLPIAEGRAIRDHLQTLPLEFAYREYPMAHQVSQESLADIAQWLTERLNAE